MSDNHERFDRIEQRLDSVESSVGEVRREVAGLRGDVGELRGEVSTLSGLPDEVAKLRGLPDEFAKLRNEVNALRVLGEARDGKIQLIAEVQSHHGKGLEQIKKDLEPLREIRDFIRTVADDHERRLTVLEKRSNQ